MLIGELMKRLEEKTMREVCDDLGVHTSTVQRKLKELGYEWDNSAKKWLWNKEEEQPLNVNLGDMIKKPGKSTKPVKKAKNKNENTNTNVNNPNDSNNNDHDSVQKDKNKTVIVSRNVSDVVQLNIFDEILETKNKNVKVQKGIYFEPEVAKALDKLVKKKMQSEFVNEAVKQILKAKGLLKE